MNLASGVSAADRRHAPNLALALVPHYSLAQFKISGTLAVRKARARSFGRTKIKF